MDEDWDGEPNVDEEALLPNREEEEVGKLTADELLPKILLVPLPKMLPPDCPPVCRKKVTLLSSGLSMHLLLLLCSPAISLVFTIFLGVRFLRM